MARLPSVLAPALALTLGAGSLPAHAEQAEWAGFTCGFASTNDPTGAVQQNPDVQFGEIDCGPWFAAEVLAEDDTGLDGPAIVDITICGWIQINNPMPTTPPFPSAHVCGSAPTVVVAAGQITYPASPVDNVYLCTQVQMTHHGRHGITETHTHDADGDPSNGIQCPLSISAGG